VAAPIAAAIRTYFRALLLGDRELLRSVAWSDHELAPWLARPTARPPVARLLAEIERMVVTCRGQEHGRHPIEVRLGGELHRLVVHATAKGPRIEACREPVMSTAARPTERLSVRQLTRI
jgi:hypothetical protein